jgi:hypothetical protein
MPFSSKRKLPEEKPLTEIERYQKIKELQTEQERRLRGALGDDLYDWLESFDKDVPNSGLS